MFKYSACIKCQALTCMSTGCVSYLHCLCLCCDLRLCSNPCLCVRPSRGSVRSPEVSAGDDQDDAARLEAERKLEELKRRRDDAESEEFERMRQKQQEAEAELEELKRKREERRKVLEEEERQKKQEEAERKAREEVGERVYEYSLISSPYLLFSLQFLLDDSFCKKKSKLY